MSDIQAAVVREKSGPFLLESIQLEELRADEVLIQIHGTGVCHTDLVVRDQYYPVPLPAVLGHEGAGVVLKAGASVSKVAPGDHVVLTYGSCGHCGNCLSGLSGYCDEFYARNFSGARPDGSSPCSDHAGQRLSGCFFSQSSFASQVVATERNVVKIRKDVPL